MNSEPFHSVSLVFFQDNATGDYGVCHKDTYDHNESFNAFWDGSGIFHDVFEHWFEFNHEYFMGEYAMNRGGECAAMGAALYYYLELGVGNRVTQRVYNFAETCRLENQYAIEEAIKNGYNNFGSKLLCNVPKQVINYDYYCQRELQCQIEELWDNVKDLKSESEDKDERRAGWIYKNSVTLEKIENLYHWGYKMAEGLIPSNGENKECLEGFIEFFNKFCKENNAEELKAYFTGIDIKLFKNPDEYGDEIVTWKAYLIGDESVELNKYFDLGEFIASKAEELEFA